MTNRIKTLSAGIASVINIVITGVLCLLALASFLISPNGRIFLALARMWARLIFFVGRVRVIHQQVGSPIDQTKPHLFLPSHESLLDIPALFLAMPMPVVMVAKRSLRLIPIFSWVMWLAGFIFIHRRNHDSAFRSIKKAGTRLQTNRSVVLFPEGTVGDGETLLPFKWGGFVLAQSMGCSVVPVGIHGAHAVLTPNHFCIFPGTIAVCLGEPMMPPKQGQPLEEFKLQVRQQVLYLKERARALASSRSSR